MRSPVSGKKKGAACPDKLARCSALPFQIEEMAQAPHTRPYLAKSIARIFQRGCKVSGLAPPLPPHLAYGDIHP